MGRSRYKIFETEHPHFLTATIVDWYPLFIDPELVRIILDSLRFLQDHDRLRLYTYVIMENHLHVVASAEDLVKEIGDFKSFTARKILDDLTLRGKTDVLARLELAKLDHKEDRIHQVWQEGNHPQQIGGDEMMRQKIEYIHNNPVRRGYVDRPSDWRYSSARNYEGLSEVLLDVSIDWS